MPFDLEPLKLEEVRADCFVAKDPLVRPVRVESPPIAVSPPGVGLMGMGPIDPPNRFEEHPIVQGAENCGGDSDTEVVGPAPNDGIERVKNGAHRGSDVLLPECIECGPQCLDGCLTRRDAHLISGFGACRGVLPDRESEEVEAFFQMDNTRLLGRERQPTSSEPGRKRLDYSLGILFGFTKHAEIIGVAHQCPWTRDAALLAATDAERCFQAMERHIG